MSRTDLHIAGRWLAGSGAVFSSHDPCSGKPVWMGHAADAGDIDNACRSARDALPAWSSVDLEHRSAILRRFAAVLRDRASSFVDALSREVGKPRWESLTEVQSMAGKIEISIDAHLKRCGSFAGGAAMTTFRAHGVVAVFGPFNFPGHLPNGHIAPALLAGNTVVFKPSERTPAVGALLVDAWITAGLPAGALNLVHGGRETGQALARHPLLNGIFFTGSARAGLWLHREFAGRPDRILALEMGGNNPLVVWHPRDLDTAALVTAQSAFITAGQRCTCARRLIVPTGANGDAFIERLTDVMRSIRVGAPADDPEPFMGPVIGADAAVALLGAERDLIARGARSLVALRHLQADTGLVAPGMIDVTAVASRPDEEHFGPLLQVLRVSDFEGAIAEANATQFGLAAGLLCDDATLWEQFRREVRAGIINWNQPLTGASSAAPFGGVGLSGNHRPGAYFAADYCSYPVASIASAELKPPASPLLGLTPPPSS